MNRKTDAEGTDFTFSRKMQPWCLDHNNRIKGVEDKTELIIERQDKIYKSMYGLNGSPKEGYVWKLEQLLDWAMPVKETAIRGARAAIWLFIVSASSAFFYATWNLLKLAWEHGKL